MSATSFQNSHYSSPREVQLELNKNRKLLESSINRLGREYQADCSFSEQTNTFKHIAQEGELTVAKLKDLENIWQAIFNNTYSTSSWDYDRKKMQTYSFFNSYLVAKNPLVAKIEEYKKEFNITTFSS